ncbi:MAG: bifunctional serine/threonine-protein kinase/formylglycine-generating enzyme family protein [Planctomycetota bacterium]
MKARPSPVDELFASLIERLEDEPGFDVQGFLEEHVDHAPALRARLERLRRVGLITDVRGESTLVHAMRDRFGVQSEVRTPPAPANRTQGTPRELLPSRVVGGRYRILAEIGRGGMGRVFRAHDLDLGREIALKVADTEAFMPGATIEEKRSWIERFLTEAQVTAQLEHPSIVPVHDIGVDLSGQLYYTMKLVEGVTLEQRIEQWHRAAEARKLVPTPEVLRIVIQVCQAVACAHERGVVHRDLKPSNVMIGRFGEVQVMDWGLAKRVAEFGSEATAGLSQGRKEGSTLAGEVLGTPTHMAPEQARGNIDAVGRMADIYGLGALLHHALKGVPPNRADGLRVHSSTKVSPELEAVCERALSVDPGARYQSAVELAEDLKAILDLRVVRALATGAWAELRMWIRRNRSTAVVAGVASLVVVVTLLLLLAARDRLAVRDVDISRLSVARDIEELEQEAAGLWPVSVEGIPAYEAWIERARRLVDELPLHRTTLNAHEGADDRRSRWQAALLRDLIVSLEEFDSGLLLEEFPVPGKGFSLPLRLRHASTMRDAFSEGGDALRAWEEALPALRSAYPGVHIEPQLGLVPLGPDPESGLWEFSDLLTGAVPKRGPDGRFAFDGDSSIVYVLIPPGEFLRGAQATNPQGEGYDPRAIGTESPPHRVRMSAFFLSKFELTQGQWWRLSGENPSQYGTSFHRTPATEDRPLETVTWMECDEVLRRVSASLPSEAQWQYACGAGLRGMWWTGDDPNDLASVANLCDQSLRERKWPIESGFEPWADGHAEPAPVGSFPANSFGLHDMHGNVAEWCLDDFLPYDAFVLYDPRSTLDPVCKTSSSKYKIFMGGAFASTAFQARIAHRPSNLPDKRDGGIGLRPARALSTVPFLSSPKSSRSIAPPGPTTTDTGSVQFFLGRGTDDGPEQRWRRKVGNFASEDFSAYAAGSAIQALEVAGVSVDLNLWLRERREDAVQVFDGAFGPPSAISGHALILRSDDTCPSMEGLELRFDPPVRGVSFWLFDDTGPDVLLRVQVTTVDGASEVRTLVPTFSAGVEGFFGCLTPSKVTTVRVLASSRGSSPEDWVYLDQLSVAH